MGIMSSKSLIKEAVSVIDTTYKNKNLKGVVIFTQKDDFVHIRIDMKGLNKNHLHGFHIHETGDLREGCASCCSHYNPNNNQHGDLYCGHAGDLGNIKTDKNGNCNISLKTNKFIERYFDDDLSNEELELFREKLQIRLYLIHVFSILNTQ